MAGVNLKSFQRGRAGERLTYLSRPHSAAGKMTPTRPPGNEPAVVWLSVAGRRPDDSATLPQRQSGENRLAGWRRQFRRRMRPMRAAVVFSRAGMAVTGRGLAGRSELRQPPGERLPLGAGQARCARWIINVQMFV